MIQHSEFASVVVDFTVLDKVDRDRAADGKKCACAHSVAPIVYQRSKIFPRAASRTNALFGDVVAFFLVNTRHISANEAPREAYSPASVGDLDAGSARGDAQADA